MKYQLLIKKTIRWDGRDETAGEFGCGDYTKTEWKNAEIIEAKSRLSAMTKARNIYKKIGKTLWFSRTGINALLEEMP